MASHANDDVLANQPFFYFTGWSNVFMPPGRPPFTRVLARCRVGPWKVARAHIECYYGFHENAYYSFDDLEFEDKNPGRTFRAYVLGYAWTDFVRARGDTSVLTPLDGAYNVPEKSCVVVCARMLPRWGARYLPHAIFNVICRGHCPNRGPGDPPTKRCAQWREEYWPKGWTQALRRRHFSELSEEQKAAMEDAFLATDDALFEPAQPPLPEVRALLRHEAAAGAGDDADDDDKNVGIPKTLRQQRRDAAERLVLHGRAKTIVEAARARLAARRADVRARRHGAGKFAAAARSRELKCRFDDTFFSSGDDGAEG